MNQGISIRNGGGPGLAANGWHEHTLLQVRRVCPFVVEVQSKQWGSMDVTTASVLIKSRPSRQGGPHM